MSMKIWDVLRHFSEHEKWGDPDKMNPVLLILMDQLREDLRRPIVVLCGYEESGHAPKSQHYKGNAVDFYVADRSFRETVAAVQDILEEHDLADKVGLGVYPEWLHPGFHLDVRGKEARWGQLGGSYVSLEQAMSEAKRRGL